jgi:Zn-dependent peptidase ImmA (M78 family)
MSKRKKPGVGRVLFAAALAAYALAAAPAGARAQVAARPQAAVGPKAAAVASATEEVLREASEIRKLPVLRPVKSGAQTRAEIERMLMRNLDEESSPEELRASELSLKRFGLLPADFRLREFLVSVLTEQILGYYDPKTQTFYLADWIDLEGQRPVMAHELVHALQDQHFNLRRFDKWPKDDSDAEAAAHALIEGDASFAMLQYVMRDLTRAAAMIKSMGGASTAKIDAAPRVLRESLVFPYERGLLWVRQLHQRGGWEAVSRAYTELPRSTEQILHPEKYFAREAPVKIDLADLSAALGQGWRRIDYDVSGEWGYYLVLDEYLRAADSSAKAAAGWGGDRYALYEKAQSGETFLAQLTSWDTEEDAREFFDAYSRRTTLRYKTTPAAADDAETRRAWQTDGGGVVVERRGARVLVLEGVPAKTDAARLSKAAWQGSAR